MHTREHRNNPLMEADFSPLKVENGGSRTRQFQLNEDRVELANVNDHGDRIRTREEREAVRRDSRIPYSVDSQGSKASSDVNMSVQVDEIVDPTKPLLDAALLDHVDGDSDNEEVQARRRVMIEREERSFGESREEQQRQWIRTVRRTCVPLPN